MSTGCSHMNSGTADGSVHLEKDPFAASVDVDVNVDSVMSVEIDLACNGSDSLVWEARDHAIGETWKDSMLMACSTA